MIFIVIWFCKINRSFSFFYLAPSAAISKSVNNIIIEESCKTFFFFINLHWWLTLLPKNWRFCLECLLAVAQIKGILLMLLGFFSFVCSKGHLLQVTTTNSPKKRYTYTYLLSLVALHLLIWIIPWLLHQQICHTDTDICRHIHIIIFNMIYEFGKTCELVKSVNLCVSLYINGKFKVGGCSCHPTQLYYALCLPLGSDDVIITVVNHYGFAELTSNQNVFYLNTCSSYSFIPLTQFCWEGLGTLTVEWGFSLFQKVLRPSVFQFGVYIWHICELILV